jgi:WD40 repeat protein
MSTKRGFTLVILACCVLLTSGITVQSIDAQSDPADDWNCSGKFADDPIQDVDWSPDGRDIAIAIEGNPVVIVSSTTCKIQTSFEAYGTGPAALAWSPDGTQLAIGSFYGTYIQVWNRTTQEIDYFLGSQVDIAVYDMAWSSDGKRLATANQGDYFGEEDSVRIWDLAMPNMWTTIAYADLISSVAWSPDGSLLAVAGPGIESRVILLDTMTWHLITTLNEPENLVEIETVGSLSWSPDGSKLAGASDDEDQSAVKIWDVVTGQIVDIYPGFTLEVEWSPDGRFLAISEYRKIKIMDTTRDRLVEEFDIPAISSAIDWSPDSRQLVYGDPRGNVEILTLPDQNTEE